jgi:SAM-dependent methyltransferase
VESEQEPSVFDVTAALDINRGRMEHVASLGLDLDRKRVIDVGGGPGHLAQFFVQRGCDVLTVEGRAENVETLRATYPGLRAEVVDIENESLARFGKFEVVFCYGLLYHTTRPDFVIENLAQACEGILLLETCIIDDRAATFEILPDSPAINQALSGLGCRPSPSYIIEQLKRHGFEHTYVPKTPPDHPDFLFAYMGNRQHMYEGHLMRQIFVASRAALDTPALLDVKDATMLFSMNPSVAITGQQTARLGMTERLLHYLRLR